MDDALDMCADWLFKAGWHLDLNKRRGIGRNGGHGNSHDTPTSSLDQIVLASKDGVMLQYMWRRGSTLTSHLSSVLSNLAGYRLYCTA